MKHIELDILLAYANRTLKPGEIEEIDRHLRSCPDCGDTLSTINTLRSIRSDDSRRLGRTSKCLTELDLAGYFDRSIDPKKKMKIEDHLSRCEFCLGELAVLTRIQTSLETKESPPAWLLDRAKDLARSSIKPRIEKRPAHSWVWQVLVPAFALLLVIATYKLWPKRTGPPSKKGTPSLITRAAPNTFNAGDTTVLQQRPEQYKVAGQTDVESNIIAEMDTVLTNELADVLINYRTGENDDLTYILTQLGLRISNTGIKQVFVSKTLLAEIGQGHREHPILLVLLDNGTVEIMQLNQEDEFNRL